MKYVLSAVEQVVRAYGLGFGMLVVGGCGVAVFIEIFIKEGFSWVEGKVTDSNVSGWLPLFRLLAILGSSVILTVKVTEGVTHTWSLPSEGFNMFVWWVWCYASQFVFSMDGIKGFLGWREKRRARREEKKAIRLQEEAQKPTLEAVPDRAYFRLRDSNGNIMMDEYGREIYVDSKGRKL